MLSGLILSLNWPTCSISNVLGPTSYNFIRVWVAMGGASLHQLYTGVGNHRCFHTRHNMSHLRYFRSRPQLQRFSFFSILKKMPVHGVIGMAAGKLQIETLRGRGWRRLQTKTRSKAGEILLKEQPLLTWKRGASEAETIYNAISAFKELPQKIQERIRNFHCPQIPRRLAELHQFGEDDLRLAATLEVCCTRTTSGEAALFEHVACANHSCRPNAAIRLDGDELRFVALRSVSEGEEVTISYVHDDVLFMPVKLRRKFLRAWDFVCLCPRCDADTSDLKAWERIRDAEHAELEMIPFSNDALESNAESSGELQSERMNLSDSMNALATSTTPNKFKQENLGNCRNFMKCENREIFPKVFPKVQGVQGIEALWWRRRKSMAFNVGASEDARLRRFALGLGTQILWQKRAERLRQCRWQEDLVNFHRNLQEDFMRCRSLRRPRILPRNLSESNDCDWRKEIFSRHHRLLSYSARDVSEIHLWRGEISEALKAAETWRFFVREMLGTTLTIEATMALEVFAAAAAIQGFQQKAHDLYKEALMEAEPLRNVWDEEDFFVPHLQRQLAELSRGEQER